MNLSYSFYILQFLILIFGLIFTIRIISFKKDAWYFYFLATLIGSFQFSNFSDFNVSEYFSNLAMYSHDLILALVAFLIYDKINIPKKISSNNIFFVCIISIITTLLMLGFNYLTLPIYPFEDKLFLISVIFGIAVYVGSILLAFGYIFGLFINCIYSIQYVIISLIIMSRYDLYSISGCISVIFSFLSFIIFLHGYTKNRKLLSNQSV